MTAEVGILNRNPVALAADSAVTLQLPEGPKIYRSNKLFTLSKYEPVGVMIYGNADFLNVPWETIIKTYRAQLGNRAFRHVDEYGEDFLNFVEANRIFFPNSRQPRYCYEAAVFWLRRLKNRLRREIADVLKVKPTISESRIREIFRRIVDDDLKHLEKHPKLPRFSRMSPLRLLRQYRGPIRQAIKDELQNLSGVVPRGRLEVGCVLAIMRDLYWNDDSGVVVAGFGTQQFRPSLRCYKLDSVIAGRLRALEDRDRSTDITPEVSASVVAFAQSEMVNLFMNGADNEYLDFIMSYMHRILAEGYPGIVDSALQKYLPSSTRRRIVRQVRNSGGKVLTALGQAMSAYSAQIHWEPIVEIVAHLPKEELAAMAEALVNLTSFKRHITREAETVGGPIDVAVISRGDGFIWIKRKHYFSPDLNPQFFDNYFYDTSRQRGNR